MLREKTIDEKMVEMARDLEYTLLRSIGITLVLLQIVMIPIFIFLFHEKDAGNIGEMVLLSWVITYTTILMVVSLIFVAMGIRRLHLQFGIFNKNKACPVCNGKVKKDDRYQLLNGKKAHRKCAIWHRFWFSGGDPFQDSGGEEYNKLYDPN